MLRDRHRRILTAAEFIGNELAFNAEIVKGYEDDSFAMEGVREQFVLSAWEQHRAEAFAFEQKDRGLWREVVEAYDALRRTVKSLSR